MRIISAFPPLIEHTTRIEHEHQQQQQQLHEEQHKNNNVQGRAGSTTFVAKDRFETRLFFVNARDEVREAAITRCIFERKKKKKFFCGKIQKS